MEVFEAIRAKMAIATLLLADTVCARVPEYRTEGRHDYCDAVARESMATSGWIPAQDAT